jgi:uncharacterized protein (DUF433 family)
MVDNVHQYVEIRQNRDGEDRPYIAGTRVRVQDIAIDYERFGHSAEEIAQGFDHVSIAQVHGALAYFFENREFVWQCIRDDEALVNKLRSQLAGSKTLGGSSDAASPAVPS